MNKPPIGIQRSTPAHRRPNLVVVFAATLVAFAGYISRTADADPGLTSSYSACAPHDDHLLGDAEDQDMLGALSARQVRVDDARPRPAVHQASDIYALGQFERGDVFAQPSVVYGEVVLQRAPAESIELISSDVPRTPAWTEYEASVTLPGGAGYFALPSLGAEMEIVRLAPDGVDAHRDQDGRYFLRKSTTEPVCVTFSAQAPPTPSYNPQRGFDPARASSPISAELIQQVQPILDEIGVRSRRTREHRRTIPRLVAWFSDFSEVPREPIAESNRSGYQEVALRQVGGSHERAMAFVATAIALDINARYVVNGHYAFAELQRSDGSWHRVDLGGTVEHERARPIAQGAASETTNDGAPRLATSQTTRFVGHTSQANVATFIELNEYPRRLRQGEMFRVIGKVLSPSGETVSGGQVVVTFVDEILDASFDSIANVSEGAFEMDVLLPPEWTVQIWSMKMHYTGAGRFRPTTPSR